MDKIKAQIISKLVSLPIGFIKGMLQMVKEGSRKDYFKTIHPTAHFDYGAYTDHMCELEDNVSVGSRTELFNCRIGRYTYFQKSCIIKNCNIGRYCSIGSHSQIGLGIHPVGLNVSTSPFFYMHNANLGFTFVKKNSFNEQYKLTTIGNDVWIGTRSIIMGGISVGDGAIVGAGTVVTKDIPPYAVVAGVPGKVIKYRFSSDLINVLLNRPWWEQETSWLKEHEQLFQDVYKMAAFLK